MSQEPPQNPKADQSIRQRLESLGKQWSALVAIVGAIVAVLTAPFALDIPSAAYVSLISLVLGGLWYVWSVWKTGPILRWLITLLILGIGGGWGYILYWSSLPHFEITAIDTLPGEKNVYELTDFFIWNQSASDSGITVRFPIEVRPIYQGKLRFGRVIAIITNEANTVQKEIVLWDDFDNNSGTVQFQLNITDTLRISGLKANWPFSDNPFGSNEPPIQQARLLVNIAREADKATSWTTEEILLRNAPWEFKSVLETVNGKHSVDVFVQNLGGAGDFTVDYRLVRLENELISDETSPMLNAVEPIAHWNSPTELVHLQNKETFQDRVELPGGLSPGRYLLETFAVKKQSYVTFNDPGSNIGDLPNLASYWWFGRYPFGLHIFIVPGVQSKCPSLEADMLAKTECERLQAAGISLGDYLLEEEVVSNLGTEGKRYQFENGAIFVHSGQVYSMYGEIFEHYQKWGEIAELRLGFPTFQIETIVSSKNTSGKVQVFEGYTTSTSARLYTSSKGVAYVWDVIHIAYAEQGYHEGWLGLPLADEQYFPESTTQMFENGYIVYYVPLKPDGERDWSQKPIAFPYLQGSGQPVEVTSHLGTKGIRYEGDNGVVYVHSGQTFYLYGPILEHFENIQYGGLGFPISEIQAVTSATGTTGTMVEFEGVNPDEFPFSLIYASEKGVGYIEGWIGSIYEEEGTHEGRLGFPIADPQVFNEGQIQPLENGSIVWYTPKLTDGNRNYELPPLSYSFDQEGAIQFEVQADLPWQDTGICLNEGDVLAYSQAGGEWTNYEAGGDWYDANGHVQSSPVEGRPLPAANAAGLIGRIGEEDANTFFVGRWNMIKVAVEGCLSLQMNSGSFGDNAGSITVQIIQSPYPSEP